MLKVGDYVTLKKNLVLGKLYGTVHFASRHAEYMGKLLIVTKISNTGTAYCNFAGEPCKFGTLHESMVSVAKFRPGNSVTIWGLKLETDGYTKDMAIYANMVTTVSRVLISSKHEFYYMLTVDGGRNNWPEKCLTEAEEDELDYLDDLFNDVPKKEPDEINEDLKSEKNENRLQEQKTVVSIGAGVKGSRVLGRLGKTSVRSRPLRNPQRIRGK